MFSMVGIPSVTTNFGTGVSVIFANCFRCRTSSAVRSSSVLSECSIVLLYKLFFKNATGYPREKSIIFPVPTQTVDMKKIHRILTALCAATICFSLPIMASCSTPGSTKPSSGEPTRREMPTESSEDSHGRFPGEPLPLLPEFPEFPGHTEGPEEGKPVHPRPVTPARPANPNNGEEMPSPRRPHGRRPDSYQPEKGRDRGGRTSDDRSRTYPNENECPRAKDCPGETDFNEQKSHRKKGNSDFAPGENKRPPRCPGRKNEIPQDGNGQNTRPTER